MSRPFPNTFDRTGSGTPMTPTSYRTNVNRQKTKKWVEAKKVDYGGDDWGDEFDEDEDEDEEYDEPSPPPASKPTGFRQPGQAADASLEPKQYGDLGGVAQPTNNLRRQNSFTAGDESRAFSTGAVPPQEMPPPELPKPSVPRLSNPTPAALHASTPAVAATGVRKPFMGADAIETPPPVSDAKPTSAGPHSAISVPMSETSDYQTRSDYSPSAAPAPLQPRSPLGPSDAAIPFSPDKPLPFIRPADIYRRAEEQEKERQSLESDRPSIDPGLGVQSHDATRNPVIPEDDEPDQEEEVVEPQSHAAEQNTLGASIEPLRSSSTSPQLPNLSRISAFGMDMFSMPPTQPEPETASKEQSLQREPSMGFTSLVHQAFDREDDRSLPSDPPSRSDSNVDRSDSNSTISPIMGRLNSNAQKPLDVGDTIAEEATEPEQPELQAPQPLPPKFKPGHRRDISTPSPHNSPARTPDIGTANRELPAGEATQISDHTEDLEWSAAAPAAHERPGLPGSWISSTQVSMAPTPGVEQPAGIDVVPQGSQVTPPQHEAGHVPVAADVSPDAGDHEQSASAYSDTPPQPLPKDTPRLGEEASAVFPTQPAPTDPNPVLSDQASEKLLKEIERHLSPSPEATSEPRNQDSELGSVYPPTRENTTHESAYYPGDIYDNYRGSTYGFSPVDPNFPGHELPAEPVPSIPPQVNEPAETTEDHHELPAIAPLRTRNSPSPQRPAEALTHKFSWERPENGDKSPGGQPQDTVRLVGEPIGQVPAKDEAVQPDADHEADHEDDATNTTPPNLDAKERDLTRMSPTPDLEYAELPAYTPLSPDEVPTEPSHTVGPTPTMAGVKLPSFKDICALGSAELRIKSFNESRMHFAAMDSGLSDWLSSQLDDANGQPTSTAQPFQQPYFQQYLSASSPTTTAPTSRPTGVFSGAQHGFSTSGRISTQQVQAKSKDLLHTAGIFGGKASKAGKGLFAKGKSKFLGGGSGDKTTTPPNVTTAPRRASWGVARGLTQLDDPTGRTVNDPSSSNDFRPPETRLDAAGDPEGSDGVRRGSFSARQLDGRPSTDHVASAVPRHTLSVTSAATTLVNEPTNSSVGADRIDPSTGRTFGDPGTIQERAAQFLGPDASEQPPVDEELSKQSFVGLPPMRRSSTFHVSLSTRKAKKRFSLVDDDEEVPPLPTDQPHEHPEERPESPIIDPDLLEKLDDGLGPPLDPEPQPEEYSRPAGRPQSMQKGPYDGNLLRMPPADDDAELKEMGLPPQRPPSYPAPRTQPARLPDPRGQALVQNRPPGAGGVHMAAVPPGGWQAVNSKIDLPDLAPQQQGPGARGNRLVLVTNEERIPDMRPRQPGVRPPPQPRAFSFEQPPSSAQRYPELFRPLDKEEGPPGTPDLGDDFYQAPATREEAFLPRRTTNEYQLPGVGPPPPDPERPRSRRNSGVLGSLSTRIRSASRERSSSNATQQRPADAASSESPDGSRTESGAPPRVNSGFLSNVAGRMRADSRDREASNTSSPIRMISPISQPSAMSNESLDRQEVSSSRRNSGFFRDFGDRIRSASRDRNSIGGMAQRSQSSSRLANTVDDGSESIASSEIHERRQRRPSILNALSRPSTGNGISSESVRGQPPATTSSPVASSPNSSRAPTFASVGHTKSKLSIFSHTDANAEQGGKKKRFSGLGVFKGSNGSSEAVADPARPPEMYETNVKPVPSPNPQRPFSDSSTSSFKNMLSLGKKADEKPDKKKKRSSSSNILGAIRGGKKSQGPAPAASAPPPPPQNTKPAPQYPQGVTARNGTVPANRQQPPPAQGKMTRGPQQYPKDPYMVRGGAGGPEAYGYYAPSYSGYGEAGPHGRVNPPSKFEAPWDVRPQQSHPSQGYGYTATPPNMAHNSEKLSPPKWITDENLIARSPPLPTHDQQRPYQLTLPVDTDEERDRRRPRSPRSPRKPRDRSSSNRNLRARTSSKDLDQQNGRHLQRHESSDVSQLSLSPNGRSASSASQLAATVTSPGGGTAQAAADMSPRDAAAGAAAMPRSRPSRRLTAELDDTATDALWLQRQRQQRAGEDKTLASDAELRAGAARRDAGPHDELYGRSGDERSGDDDEYDDEDDDDDNDDDVHGAVMSATSYPGQEWNPYGDGVAGWEYMEKSHAR